MMPVINSSGLWALTLWVAAGLVVQYVNCYGEKKGINRVCGKWRSIKYWLSFFILWMYRCPLMFCPDLSSESAFRTLDSDFYFINVWVKWLSQNISLSVSIFLVDIKAALLWLSDFCGDPWHRWCFSLFSIKEWLGVVFSELFVLNSGLCMYGGLWYWRKASKYAVGRENSQIKSTEAAQEVIQGSTSITANSRQQ